METTRRFKRSEFGYAGLLPFSLVILLAVGTLLLTSGCKKSAEESPPAPTPSAAAPSPTAAPPAAGGSAADTTAKLTGIEWALKQDEIKNDPNGQWAIEVTASSTYGDAQGQASYSANQATGLPNVEKYADNSNAWCPKTPDSGIEWLDLKYPKPVHATEVRVRESYGSGAVIKVELFDEHGGAHSVWAGNDPTKELNYLIVKFPQTDFKTARVKLTLATNVIAGWHEIDAVQLVGTEQ